jgi:tRNA G18 (ribose-2'-O)-methylase SpoU
VPRSELNIIPVQAFDDPRIAEYRAIRDAHLRQFLHDADRPESVFIAEGELVVRQLVASSFQTRSVLLTPQRLTTVKGCLEQLPPATPVYLVDQPVMNAIVGFNIHRGILAAGIRPDQPDLTVLLRSSSSLVILEDLSNHDNVGGVFRCAAALAGIPRPDRQGTAILLSPRCCDPLYRKAIRVSVGTALRLPFARIEPWPDRLRAISRSGFTVLALTPDPTATPIEQVTLPPGTRPALVLGAEGSGLTPESLALADVRVRIPISPDVDSLNVVTAAAIALHRFCRLPAV